MTDLSPDTGTFLVTVGVRHPRLLFFFVGLFVGVSIVPEIIRLIRWGEDVSAYLRRREESHKTARHTFSMLLDRAYKKWLESHPGTYPQTVDALTDQCKPPHRMRFTSLRTDDVKSTLEESNFALWNFCEDLYCEIIRSQRDRNFPSNLLASENEYKDFSDARRQLAEFWDIEAHRIYTGAGLICGRLWLRNLSPLFRYERLFRQLPFLEVALARQLTQGELGHRHLFELCRRAMEIAR